MKTLFVNAAIIVIIACIVAAIVIYLIRAKKHGENCIGCPYAKQCGGKCNGSCHHDERSE